MTDTQTPAAVPAAPPVPAFLRFLSGLEDGKLIADANDTLKDLSTGLADIQRSRGGKQTGAITITVTMIDNGKEIEALATITSKMPKPVRHRSFLFRHPDGTLSRNHPGQTSLALAEPVGSPEERRQSMAAL